MRRRQFLIPLLALPAAGLPGALRAQPADAVLGADQRALLYELLSWQCGAADEIDRFRQAIGRLGPAAEPLLRQVLAGGVPAERRQAAAERAAARFREQRAWLAGHPDEPLAAQAAESRLAQDETAYVEDALRRLDALYRNNAVRGLGEVGGPGAAAAIEAAARQNPDLALLGQAAIAAINRRR